MSAAETIEFGPQPGPQTEFLSTSADIALYGGAAGGGKSFGLLLDPLRHAENPGFGAVIFRRTSVQVRNEGGLWDESLKIYPFAKARGREFALEWELPSAARIKFSHLEYDKNVYDWQGSSIAMIGFDELTHFTEFQFWYMLSRNRSTCGVRPYVRATTNPDVDSWVRKLISWWIDPSSGLPIPERSGVLRWFIRQNDAMIWADSAYELFDKYGRDCGAKSFTFIPSKLSDNKILMKNDPGYLANLKAQSRVDRARLLDGNWNVRASAGTYFRREWMRVIPTLPAGWIDCVRYWDKGATLPSESNKDPDWTRGLLLYKYPNGKFVVANVRSMRDTPLQVEQFVLNTASHDGRRVKVVVEQDPGSAGVADAANYTRLLVGYEVRVRRPDKDKETRAKPASAQAEAGNIDVLQAPWNDEFFSEIENFPDGAHDDQVDVLSGAFNEMSGGLSILDVL